MVRICMATAVTASELADQALTCVVVVMTPAFLTMPRDGYTTAAVKPRNEA